MSPGAALSSHHDVTEARALKRRLTFTASQKCARGVTIEDSVALQIHHAFLGERAPWYCVPEESRF